MLAVFWVLYSVFCILFFSLYSAFSGSACFLRWTEKSIKMKLIMRNKANFRKSQMFITATVTMNYNEKSIMDTWSKQTQTKPNFLLMLLCTCAFLWLIQNVIESVKTDSNSSSWAISTYSILWANFLAWVLHFRLRRIIWAPEAAALPMKWMRSSGRLGNRPILRALSRRM